jgi:hypothetical protein
MNISNLMNGSENDMLFLKEIIGDAFIAVHRQHKYIIKNTQKEISEKSRLNG